MRRLIKTAIFLTLWAWCLMVVLPMVWMVYNSFKPSKEIFANPWSLPTTFDFSNYVLAWAKSNVGVYFLNSMLVVGVSLLITLLLSAMAAYGLAVRRFKGGRLLYFVFILGMMIPTALSLAPLFSLMRSLSLVNSLTGLALVYVAFSIPFSVLVLYGFFASLPAAMREASIVDGASEWQTFWYVYLPMARPGVVTVTVFNFLGLWNEYLLGLVLLIDPDKQTLPIGIANMVVSMNYRSEWGPLFAAMVLAMIPVLAIYSALHKRVVEGMVMGALKG
jgi:N-acetylglucosamine transport system permease protein